MKPTPSLTELLPGSRWQGQSWLRVARKHHGRLGGVRVLGEGCGALSGIAEEGIPGGRDGRS